MKKFRPVLFICAILSLFIGVLVGTQLGLRLTVKVVHSLSGGIVTIDSVSGRLATAYSLDGVTISTPAADIDVENFNWSWRPLSLFAGELDLVACGLQTVTVRFKPVKGEEKVQDNSSKFQMFTPPLSIVMEAFTLQDLKIIASDGTLAFQIDTFDTSLELVSSNLRIHNFSLDGPEVGLSFHGSAAIAGDQNLDFTGNWRVVEYGFHPSKGTFSAKGPINKLGVHVALNEPGEIHVIGEIENLLSDPTWTADLDAKNVNLETWILYCPEIILDTVHGDMSGDFTHYRGLVVADGHWGVADNLHLQSNIDGGVWGIVFDSLRIDRHGSSAVATNASISWEKLFSWEADLDFQNFVPAMFFPEFDGSASSTFHSVGDVTEDGLEASFALRTMEGRLADYAWSATGNISLTEERIFSSDLVLNSDSVGGQAIVRQIELSWVDKLSWIADLDFDNFDPGFLHPEAAGKVSGRINSSLTWNEDLPVGFLEILDLSGELRGAELYGGGTIAIDGSVLNSSGLELRLDESRLSLLGTVDEELGLEFTLASPDISVISPALKGSLNLAGNVTGSKVAPKLDLTLSGNQIQVEEDTIGNIRGHLKAGLESDGPINGDLLLEDSTVNGYDISQIGATVTGTMLNHLVHTKVQSTEGSVQLDLVGRRDKDWSGRVSDATLMTHKYGNWAQLDSANVAYSSQGISLDGFCFTNSGSNDNGKACISASSGSTEMGAWSIITELSGFELKPFTEMSFGLPPLTGSVEGSLKARGDSHGVKSAQLSATIPSFDTLLNVTEADFVSVQLRDSIITADLEDENLGLHLFFRSNKGGTLSLKGTIHNFGSFSTPLSKSAISGELKLDKYYLSSLAAFTGYGIEPTGWVSSSLGIAGSLAQPEVYGRLAIQEGGLELPYQGISLENVVVDIDSREFGAFLHLKANSGGGELNGDGYVSHDDNGVEVSLGLTGEEFLLVNLPEYSFRVNPEVVVKINGSRGQIDGRIVVPSGLLAPEELREAVKVSEDVVYLGEEKNHEKKGFPWYLDLDVELGKDVKVDGYGLEGRLSGGLNVKVTPADFLTGRGELDLLDSTFTLYGRSLDIERGRVLFTGGPIDNPGVDIRAQKSVTAETARGEGYTVGVDINGLVQDLQFHLFSDPFMEDTEILSQMVVGHSFATSSEEEGTMLRAAAMSLGLEGSSKLMKGIGNLLLIDDLHLEGSEKDGDVSLVVGKRITEDLYIGYDMNMFSQLGQFRVRYDLSRGFYVETRSSSESTGADLIYTFER